MAKQKRKPKKKSIFKKLKLWTALITTLVIGKISYQIYQAPSVMFKPLEQYFMKTPKQTVSSYMKDFTRAENRKIEAEFLAAVVQQESSGNPLATTDWGFRWSLNPVNWYRPFSSATGAFQITRPTWQTYLRACKNLCDPPRWATRLSVGDSSALVSNWYFKKLLENRLIGTRSKRSRTFLSILHLCGQRRAERWLRNGHSLKKMRCGYHRVSKYINSLERHYQGFKKITQTNPSFIAKR
ncbi:MAG: transglycosylase SLT domain-containing protein [Bdellovibrionales bacterium]